MEEPEIINPDYVEGAGAGFRISDEPVVESRRSPEEQTGQRARSSSDWLQAFGDDALYVIARDPKTLFIYWNLGLSKRFAEAGLGVRELHSRVLREDGSEEAAGQIEPALGYAFVEVSSPGGRYTCELGCFEGSEWKTLARSGVTETPAAAMSDDLEAEFATLPLHLSFQRLIDIFRTSPQDKKTLALSLAGMQARARTLEASMSTADWSKLVNLAAASVDAEAGFGLSGVRPSELAALLRTVKCNTSQQAPSPENLVRLRELGESLVGSSWGGSSL